VTIGIRPEHLQPVARRGGKALAELTVEHVEPLGADTLAHGRLGTAASECTIRLPENSSVSDGDRIPVAAETHNIHVFDSGTGRRVGDVSGAGTDA
jgi:sn-glycerol 3-phosphate transport system ATP-binding protein